jgi:hypothetical protein
VYTGIAILEARQTMAAADNESDRINQAGRGPIFRLARSDCCGAND